MNKIRTWIKQYFCRHPTKKTILVYWPDRYEEEICLQCGKHIYSDI
ncbi:hypothetical protein [Adhaeribacter arboris]|nr:hypothetical protein [Adhaeribacter arboris]